MIQIIERESLTLHEIEAEFKENFEPRTGCCDLTSFEQFWLKKTGDLLRPKDSQHFWTGNSYCWWEREYNENGNPVRDKEFSVWLDKSGNCMYEDHDSGKLFRVMF